MKKLILIAVAFFGFATLSYAADNTSEATTTLEVSQSPSEKVKSFVEKLYRYANEDNIESFVYTLRQFEEYMEGLNQAQQQQIEYELAGWYEDNKYKMNKISYYSEYVEDVLEGRIER